LCPLLFEDHNSNHHSTPSPPPFKILEANPTVDPSISPSAANLAVTYLKCSSGTNFHVVPGRFGVYLTSSSVLTYLQQNKLVLPSCWCLPRVHTVSMSLIQQNYLRHCCSVSRCSLLHRCSRACSCLLCHGLQVMQLSRLCQQDLLQQNYLISADGLRSDVCLTSPCLLPHVPPALVPGNDSVPKHGSHIPHPCFYPLVGTVPAALDSLRDLIDSSHLCELDPFNQILVNVLLHDDSSHTCVHQVSLPSCFNSCVFKMDIFLKHTNIYVVDALVEACLASSGLYGYLCSVYIVDILDSVSVSSSFS
jgi:hypothetical protein